jgi:hypothetical protein
MLRMALVTAGLAVLPTTASAATIVGSDLSRSPGDAGYGWCSGTSPGVRCTILQLTLGTADQAVPAAGVITRWSVRDARGELALRVIDGPPGARHVVAAGPAVQVPGPGIQTFPAQIPVSAGQRIGVEVGETGFLPILYRDEVTAGEHYDPPLGATPSAPVPGATEERTYEILYNAVIEPDADHDGLGDETQDPDHGGRAAAPSPGGTTTPSRGTPAPASGGTGPAPASGGATVCAARGVLARAAVSLVYRSGARVLGCAGGRRTLIGTAGHGATYRLVRLNGEQAALVRVSAGRSSVVVVDLGRGRTTLVSSRTSAGGPPSAWTVTALVVAPSGDAAWISRPAGEPDRVGVWIRHGGRVQQIDSGSIRPTSLRLSGTGIVYADVHGGEHNSSFR